MFVRLSSPVPFVSLFREGDGGEGGGGNPPAKPTFDASQQEHVNALLSAERKNAEDRTEQRLKDEAAKRDTDAKAEADRKAAEAKGEFETVKQSLESERDTARTELDTAKSERDALSEYFHCQFASALKDLPEQITAFAPAEGASFADKKAWLGTAQEKAGKLGGTAKQGKGPNPTESNGKRDLEAAAKQARSSGKYTA